MRISPRWRREGDLPERNVYRLRMDHPVFHSFYNIDKVRFATDVKDGMVTDPYPYSKVWTWTTGRDHHFALDFSLGWEANATIAGIRGQRFAEDRANIVAYATAMRDAGRSVGRGGAFGFGQEDGGKFRVGRSFSRPWKTRTARFRCCSAS